MYFCSHIESDGCHEAAKRLPEKIDPQCLQAQVLLQSHPLARVNECDSQLDVAQGRHKRGCAEKRHPISNS